MFAEFKFACIIPACIYDCGSNMGLETFWSLNTLNNTHTHRHQCGHCTLMWAHILIPNKAAINFTWTFINSVLCCMPGKKQHPPMGLLLWRTVRLYSQPMNQPLTNSFYIHIIQNSTPAWSVFLRTILICLLVVSCCFHFI